MQLHVEGKETPEANPPAYVESNADARAPTTNHGVDQPAEKRNDRWRKRSEDKTPSSPTAERFSSTIQFTRRGRPSSVVSREKRMRLRSECNAWFGVCALRPSPILGQRVEEVLAVARPVLLLAACELRPPLSAELPVARPEEIPCERKQRGQVRFCSGMQIENSAMISCFLCRSTRSYLQEKPDLTPLFFG
jgi:hypothetical protein